MKKKVWLSEIVKYYIRCYILETSELILKTKTNTTIRIWWYYLYYSIANSIFISFHLTSIAYNLIKLNHNFVYQILCFFWFSESILQKY